jgi:hypothetical protein
MKATIRADGMLIIRPESDLEAYALSHWSEENLKTDWYRARERGYPVVVDLSGYDVRVAAFPIGQGS